MTIKDAAVQGLSDDNKIIVKETTNKLIISTPGPAGQRGNSILNGNGAPANNLGMVGDYYYDKTTTNFYGPKLSLNSWSDVTVFALNNPSTDYSKTMTWELAQIQEHSNPDYYYVELTHNLNFYPNITVQDSAGDLWETGIIYNSVNKITLTMAQPFSGTAYLS